MTETGLAQERTSSSETETFDQNITRSLLSAQRNEITEYVIYDMLSQSVKGAHNKEILKQISEDELEHYHFWKKYTGREIKPDRWKIWGYYLISKVFGITFGMKLMEKGEERAQASYGQIAKVIPAARDIEQDENDHEKELINLIDEERLKYIGSMVLGLNDGLVELTGVLAGLTWALRNTGLIATAGLITGIAGSLSMAASEYLSTKSEGGVQDPLKASLYTGSVYVIAVLFLIFPYLIFGNYFFCLGLSVLNAILLILVFTLYVSVARDIPFRKRFFEMAGISLGIAAITFGIGILVKTFLGLDV